MLSVQSDAIGTQADSTLLRCRDHGAEEGDPTERCRDYGAEEGDPTEK